MHSSIRTVFTIHNLGYQGKGSLSVLDKLDVRDEDVKVLSRKQEVSELNALGEGIVHADIVTTVSKTYAKEIAEARKKRKSIASYLRLRARLLGRDGKIRGIINGIDTKIWDPKHDSFLPHKYDESSLHLKIRNKEVLLRKYGFAQDSILYAFVGRFAEQKGIDLLYAIALEVATFPVGVILLGSGANKKSDERVKRLEEEYRSTFRVHVGYSEEEAHLLFGSADYLLIPSHYEPCGLVQMIGMRYGSVPVASDTGGLHDTIRDAQTGFLFRSGSSREFLRAIKRSIDVYRDQERYSSMRQMGMREDFSWEKSARGYRDLYQELFSSTT